MTRTMGMILLLGALLAVGCGEASEPAAGETSVRTVEAYKEEARAEITADNAEAKLDALLSEIDADTDGPE